MCACVCECCCHFMLEWNGNGLFFGCTSPLPQWCKLAKWWRWVRHQFEIINESFVHTPNNSWNENGVDLKCYFMFSTSFWWSLWTNPGAISSEHSPLYQIDYNRMKTLDGDFLFLLTPLPPNKRWCLAIVVSILWECVMCFGTMYVGNLCSVIVPHFLGSIAFLEWLLIWFFFFFLIILRTFPYFTPHTRCSKYTV